ncbi:kinetochore protein Nuf2, partial [Geospiza fortis]|uniref:Kinetochore protein Nuf2 n=1 Tax=Geospiza fortis TaxID=48883 RepID=A0A8N5I4X4_GEOFO
MSEQIQRGHEDAQRAGATLVWGQAELGLCSLEMILGKTSPKGFLERRKSDLLHRQLEVLHLIYLRILQKVCGIRLEHAYMMPFNVDIMYPQIYEGFLPVCNLYIHMERLLPMCRISDFQIADVLNPKTKRTVRFLSGILNFVNFRESRREVYLELQQSYVRL